MLKVLPRLYAILDAETVASRQLSLLDVARGFHAAGVSLLQYRDKISTVAELLDNAQNIREIFSGSECALLLNDWPEIAVEAEWDGVHVGQGDMSVHRARQIVGSGRWVGVSTHNAQQVAAAQISSADYVATGPVFHTTTKTDVEPVIGLHGIRQARDLTDKPLVAIGGIKRVNARSVIEAGADCVAVIGDLLSDTRRTRDTVRAFLQELL